MDGAPSLAVELLSQQIDELTQVICTEQIVSTGLRADFFELQDRVNSSFFASGNSSYPTYERILRDGYEKS